MDSVGLVLAFDGTFALVEVNFGGSESEIKWAQFGS